MKQRLGVAAALLGEPDLLVLDEPTNGLDPAGMADMRALLVDVAAGGQTVLLSSHLLAEVQEICDRVGIISGGRLLVESTVADLRGATGIRLVAEPVDRALAVAMTVAGDDAVEVDGAALRVSGPAAQAPELARALVGAGVDITELTPVERSLEDVFFDLTRTVHRGGAGMTALVEATATAAPARTRSLPLVDTTRAELRRILRWPATWVLAGVWLLLDALFGYVFDWISYRTGETTGPADAGVQLSSLLPAAIPDRFADGMPMFGGAIVMILGALAVGSGYGWGTWKTVYTQGPSRAASFGGTLVALLVLVAGLVLATVGARPRALRPGRGRRGRFGGAARARRAGHLVRRRRADPRHVGRRRRAARRAGPRAGAGGRARPGLVAGGGEPPARRRERAAGDRGGHEPDAGLGGRLGGRRARRRRRRRRRRARACCTCCPGRPRPG